MEREGKKYEDYAYVLDDLPHGRPGGWRPSYRTRGIIQLVGENFFTLLEAAPQKDATLSIRERIYIGKAGRAKVDHIIGRIGHGDLTVAARGELSGVIETIIRSDEKRFLEFFNRAQPITTRLHALELIPGIGKRLMWQIIEQRERRPFESFQDLQERVNIVDPARLLARRVLEELMAEEKYLFFTRPL